MINRILNKERADYILYNASKIYSANPLEIKRTRYNVWCRIAIAVTLLEEGSPITKISSLLSKDYATILHYIKTHSSNLEFDKEYKSLFEKFRLVLGDQTNTKDYLLNDISSKIYDSTCTLKALGYDWNFIEKYLKTCFQESKLKIA